MVRRSVPTALAFAGPATAVEAVIGGYSLITGELAMPPWTSAGLVALLVVLGGGVVSLVAGSFWMAAPAREEPQ